MRLKPGWYADKNASHSDLQFHLGLGSGFEAGIAKLNHAGVTLNSALMRPRSRGTVRLASANPAAAPLINPNDWNAATIMIAEKASDMIRG